MTRKRPTATDTRGPDARAERLKAALKANIAKRKAQARARASDGVAQTDTKTGKTPQP
jgi:hypothetical protein